ncbi:ABC transporter substrate-binding protein [Desulfomonile tiedjei]|uniref:Amino acid/amide ABC transporter substrate-binding protein, HAAT family n=1 Tax=Desulfomonile tiedjei (strain ATCC 49306 / DSM 6799 / DCB-1) TaxID=706587 RepID=I4C8D9_DESTA|nr:ABC transporter substrate-binding protein [Desulfomonile tiedjei]AFM25830.1 amino acid/amide ABC transporter substrate-binding protein, HAAT family [Desulfomonile tiedjei DSM 6799]
MKNVLTAMVLFVVCLAAWAGSPAMAEEPILIGVPTSLTALEGRESLKAVEMAVAEINAKGGVKVGNSKRELKLETIDLRDFSPGVPVQEALLGIEKIITEKKVAAIVVGPFRSEALLAGMDLLAKYKVPMLGTIAMTPKSEEKVKADPEKYKYCFRVCLNAVYLVKYLAQSLGSLKNDFGFNKIFAMHQDVLWAKATAEGTLKVASGQFGWENLGTEAYPTGSSDFSAGLSKAKSKGAQVILPVFDMAQSGILLKQWQQMKIPAMVAGFISPMAGPGAWKTFEGKIGGLLNTTFEIGSAIPTEKYAPAKKFYDDYAKKYGTPMEAGHGPAPSYDSVYILAEAIERAGTLDPDKLVAEIKKTDRAGVIGRIKFDDGNQVIYGNDPTQTACGCIFQWTDDGKRVIVFPEALAEGKIKLPSWVKTSK